MDSTQITFGRRLRTLRKQRGLTLERLGTAADIGFKHVSQIERGVKAPSFQAIDRLSRALKVQPFELFLPTDTLPADAEVQLRKLVNSMEKKGRPAVRRFLLATLSWAQQIETEIAG